MATIAPFISGMGETVSLYRRQFDTPRDPTTGWPPVIWGEGDFDPDDYDCDDFVCEVAVEIDVMIKPMGIRIRDTPEGRIFENRARLYTATVLSNRDRISYDGYIWEVEDVQYNHLLLGESGYYHCTIIQLEEPSAEGYP